MNPLETLDSISIRLHRCRQTLEAYKTILTDRNALVKDAVAYGLLDQQTTTLAFLLGCKPQNIPNRLDRHILTLSMRLDEIDALKALAAQARSMMNEQGVEDPNWPDAQAWEEQRVQDRFAPEYTRDDEAAEGIANFRAEWMERTNGLPAIMLLRNVDAMERHKEYLTGISESLANTLITWPDSSERDRD